jgi:murein DD-endopeptidase MepM/ murein hydrolase activator NlpD
MEFSAQGQKKYTGHPAAPWYAYVLFLFFSIVPLLGALHYYIQQTGYFYAVYVDGEEIGLLEEEEKLEEMLTALQKEAELYYKRSVVPVESVTTEEVFRPQEKQNEEKVFSHLRYMLSYKVDSRMITVNGKDIFPVAADEDVEKVIELVQGAYITNDAKVSLQKVQMEEKISSREYYAYPEELYDVETVAAFLLRGTDRKKIYLVSRGDSLWEIASDHNLSVDDLKDANPQIDGDLIREGDEISLIVPEPMVNVITVERMVQEENIPFKTEYIYDSNMWRTQTNVVEEGVFGRKEVLYQITRENGVEIERQIISESVVKEPESRLVASGTANIPSKGTGSFVWPVDGGGKISSSYGWRSGGFHAGLDIAAPTGTAVLASDSGVVVSSGWESGFGNSIVIYHGHYYTRYAHNSRNLVKNGQAVNKGQVIANVGSTGRSTGPHLHFEIRTGGMYGSTVNPLNFFSP